MGFTVTGDIVKASSNVAIEILLLNMVGVIVANYPRAETGNDHGLISKPTTRALSKIATNVFVPCLVASNLGSGLSPGLLADSYPLVLWALFNVTVAYIVAWILSRVFRIHRAFRNEFLAACMFQNNVGIPLIVMQALCKQPQLNGEPQCLSRATTFVFIFNLGWSLVFWSFGFHLISSGGKQQSSTFGGKILAGFKNSINPPILGSLMGLAIGLIPGIQPLFFGEDPPLRAVANAAETLGQPVVGVMALIAATSLGKTVDLHSLILRAVAFGRRLRARCVGRGWQRMDNESMDNSGIEIVAGAGAGAGVGETLGVGSSSSGGGNGEDGDGDNDAGSESKTSSSRDEKDSIFTTITARGAPLDNRLSVTALGKIGETSVDDANIDAAGPGDGAGDGDDDGEGVPTSAGLQRLQDNDDNDDGEDDNNDNDDNDNDDNDMNNTFDNGDSTKGKMMMIMKTKKKKKKASDGNIDKVETFDDDEKKHMASTRTNGSYFSLTDIARDNTNLLINRKGSTDDSLRAAAGPTTSIVSTASTVYGRSSIDMTVLPTVQAAADFKASKKDLLTLILGRVILIATIQFVLVASFAKHTFSGPNATLQVMVALAECISPTANMIVVVSMREGRTSQAEIISRAMVFQFILAVGTFTVFIAVALALFF